MLRQTHRQCNDTENEIFQYSFIMNKVVLKVRDGLTYNANRYMYLVKQNLALCNLSDSMKTYVRRFETRLFVKKTQTVARLQRSHLKMNDVKQMLVILKSVSENDSLPHGSRSYSNKMNNARVKKDIQCCKINMQQ